MSTLEASLSVILEEYENLSHTESVTKDSMWEFEKKKEELSAELDKNACLRAALEKSIADAEGELSELVNMTSALTERRGALDVEAASAKERREGIFSMKKALEDAISSSNERLSELASRRESTKTGIADKTLEKASLEEKIASKDRELAEYAERIKALEAQSLDIRAEQKSLIEKKESAFRLVTQLKSRLEELENEKTGILTRLAEDYDMDFDMAVVFASSSHSDHTLSKEEKEERLNFLRAEMKKLGSVNLDSIEEYRETNERYTFLKAQFDDATDAKTSLEKMIVQLDSTMREKFSESLVKIQKAFRETFVELFGGGSAEIIVSGDDVLDCSIDINVQPPGKIIKSLSLLSGGEQSIVAIALYLAILKVSPSPFCIFDEIEAALDDANVARFGEYLRKYSLSTQFIVITHRRGTMESADMLYGITMQEKGVSDFIRVSLDEYQGEIN